ncbi:MAG: hypothetical protein E6Q97_27675 [Desulfurellales bacterium]|nr:MAG: hypothetical protein E6Q97_27675 [Desulfurellales bacterium]
MRYGIVTFLALLVLGLAVAISAFVLALPVAGLCGLAVTVVSAWLADRGIENMIEDQRASRAPTPVPANKESYWL